MIRWKDWSRSVALTGALALGFASAEIVSAEGLSAEEAEVLRAPLSRDDPRSRLDPALEDVAEMPVPEPGARSRRSLGTPRVVYRYLDPDTGKTSVLSERALRRLPRGALGAPAQTASDEELGFAGSTGAVPPDAMPDPDPDELGGVRLVFGSDGRTRITPTTTYPARTRTKLVMFWGTQPGGSCTGTLIGPRHVATAAHCLYDKGKGGFATRVRVIPGLDGTYMPFGEVDGRPVLAVDGGDPKHDYGVIRLNSEIGRSTGWLGIRVFSDSTLEKASATVAGYPGEPGGGTKMYGETDTLSHVDSALLKYNRIDTSPGQSGAGITIPYGSYTYVAGIHSGSCHDTYLGWQYKNCGPRITSDRFKRIFNVIRQYRSTYERSMDRPGRDYRSFEVSGTSTAPCQNACMQESKCAAWTLVAPGVQGSKARCWLKSSVPAKRASSVNTSGVKYSIEPGFDRSGKDYRSVILPSGASDQACLSNCLRDNRCRAWTFVPAGVQGSTPRCWLKDSVPTAIGSGVTTSGVVGAS